MLFQRSSALPLEYSIITKRIEQAEAVIAMAWPKIVYSQEEVQALDAGNPYPNISVIDALLAIGILERCEYRRNPDTGFHLDDGFDFDEDTYLLEVKYKVTGIPMSLINDFRTLKAEPYFISFHSGGALAEAQSLHTALQSAGIKGFLSDDLPNGAPWKQDAAYALRAAKTVILIESEIYHQRPRCIVERNFGVANGARVLRIGLTPRGDLKDCPAWLEGGIQHQIFWNGGVFDLGSVLALKLPNIANLALRKRAGLELIRGLSESEVRSLATTLGVRGQITGEPDDWQNRLAEIMFGNNVKADQFGQEFDLLAIF